jgi:uracil phosphoribosyltransferase
MINIIDNSVVKHFLTIMRDKNTDSPRFRNAVNIVSNCIAVEASKAIPTESFLVETPLEVTTGYKISSRIILLPILRAGLGMLNSFLDIFPMSVVGYHGLRRSLENHTENEEYYYSLPEIKPSDRIIILDPMIATGNSICSSMNRLQLSGAEHITICSLIAAPLGIEKILTDYPNVDIFTCSLDKGLNDKNYILPGLGDAGDRINGC